MYGNEKVGGRYIRDLDIAEVSNANLFNSLHANAVSIPKAMVQSFFIMRNPRLVN